MNIVNPPHPDQPIVLDEHGRARFKENVLVNRLATQAGVEDVTEWLEGQSFDEADRAQLFQLLGFDVYVYGMMKLVGDEKFAEIEAAAERVRLGGSNEHR